MGVKRGVEKEPFHIKDKFLGDVDGGRKMGSWGITMRESDYGLDLLGTIVDTQIASRIHMDFDSEMRLTGGKGGR